MSKPQELLEFVARHLVDHPDDVRVEAEGGDRETTFNLYVNDADVGKVIGKRGRTAKALRQLIDSAGSLEDMSCNVEIID